MESGTIKVHRKQRQRRNNNNNILQTTAILQQTIEPQQQHYEADETASTGGLETIYCPAEQSTKTTTNAQQQQQTLLLLNGKLLGDDDSEANTTTTIDIEKPTGDDDDKTTTTTTNTNTTIVVNKDSLELEEPRDKETTEVAGGGGGGGGCSSSRNSSGDALSLKETLQQLAMPLTVGSMHHHHRSHHHSRHHSRTHSVSPHSPQSPVRHRSSQETADGSNSGSSGSLQQHQPTRTGIHGFMERELKQGSPTPTPGGSTRKLQTLSDPTGSPLPRSLRSRSSLERSPRRKRSKSESRRRRERKLIAAGEMEVRQANETLMRYLKQCSEMNDASLSGELEIDQNYDERRVMRKTKSQRDKRGHIINKLYSAGGLTSILKELTDDIAPAEGEEIYNPFTPVVSPTEDETPPHIEKMYYQTSNGYRQLNHHHHHHQYQQSRQQQQQQQQQQIEAINNRNNGDCMGISESHCLLDRDYRRHKINTNIELACVVQRVWLLISNICHGLLAGLALAHLLFIISSHPLNWSRITNAWTSTQLHDSSAGSSSVNNDDVLATMPSNLLTDNSELAFNQAQANKPNLLVDYATFSNIYLNTFYCLTIICLVSVLDRMDVCRWDYSNATEFISFRWLVITMIYIAIIILTICSDSIHEKLYFSSTMNVSMTQQEMLTNRVLSVWSSLSVARSIGAICGWIMIGLTPHDDMLFAHLVDLTKYQMQMN